jgi:dipeptide transport system permease protein
LVLVLILTFSVDLGWTPVSGRISLDYDFDRITGFMTIDALLSDQDGAFESALSHLILPTIALGTIPLAVIARMTRSSMLEVLHEDYIRTAKAKGLAPPRVVWIHALRNALIPVITILGPLVVGIITGSVVVENLFGIPGLGKEFVTSILNRDYNIVIGVFTGYAALVGLANLAVDLVYPLVDPRIRY